MTRRLEAGTWYTVRGTDRYPAVPRDPPDDTTMDLSACSWGQGMQQNTKAKGNRKENRAPCEDGREDSHEAPKVKGGEYNSST